MKYRSMLAAIAISLLLPGVVLAQDAAPAPGAETAADLPPRKVATAEEIALATSLANAAIAKAKVGDLFENVTDSNVPAVRHKLSGMVCKFDPDKELSIHVYDGLPRGDDVSCSDQTLSITQTLYATRYPQRPTARQIVEASLVAIRQRFTDIKAYEGTAVSIKREGKDLPQIATSRMEAKLDGQAVFSKSSAVVIGDWVIAQRVTGPITEATVADLLAEMTLTLVIDEVTKRNAKGE